VWIGDPERGGDQGRACDDESERDSRHSSSRSSTTRQSSGLRSQRIEITATVSEAVASAFEQKKALPKEGSLVVLRDIAGARFVSRYHRTRIREISRHTS
jgi:hypothetical protein